MSTIRIKLSRIQDQAEALHRPEMYADYVSRGAIDGQYLVATAAVQKEMRAKYHPRGLGDVVAIVAHPIAKASDAILKTNFKNCGGCPNRQEYLNEKLPFKP